MSEFDAEAHRQSSLEAWEAASSGWRSRRAQIAQWGLAVSQQMIDDVDPRPGERVLELAAGLGETGLMAAERVGPSGHVIVSDQAEGMLAAAGEQAGGRGLENVELKVLNAEWIDLPLASVDIVLCRYGYMLMADPAAALAETRRVLRPGGRLALAVWDAIGRNPWAQLPGLELLERGLGQGMGGAPGPFALGSEERVLELLGGAGFVDARVTPVEMLRRHDTFTDFWEVTLDLSHSFHDAVLSQAAEEVEQIKTSLERRFESYRQADGSLAIPGRTLAARGEA